MKDFYGNQKRSIDSKQQNTFYEKQKKLEAIKQEDLFETKAQEMLHGVTREELLAKSTFNKLTDEMKAKVVAN